MNMQRALLKNYMNRQTTYNKYGVIKIIKCNPVLTDQNKITTTAPRLLGVDLNEEADSYNFYKY